VVGGLYGRSHSRLPFPATPFVLAAALVYAT